MSLVRTEIADRVALITLCDPEHRNALTLPMADELATAIENVERQEVGAIVVTGEPPAFCAGADLGVLERGDGTELVRIYKAFTRLYQCNIPSIAAVNGAAVGAGFNLALSADMRLASTSAFFDTGFLKLAVHPGGGATWLLTRQLGLQATMALTMFVESLDGPEAQQRGLVWKCLPDDELLPTAMELAQRAARHPPVLMQKLNHTIGRMFTISEHGPAVQAEMDEQLWSLRQPEAQAAIRARRGQISTQEIAPASPASPDPAASATPGSEEPPPKPGEPGFKLFADD